MHHGNRDQRAKRLQQQPSPFYCSYGRLADNDALPSRFQSILKRGDGFVLRRPLTFVMALWLEWFSTLD
jgi:hypothetical protein